MSESTLATYLAKTRAYLASPEGRAGQALCLRLGYSYQRRMAAAVMTATRLIKYERISEVVQALVREELRVVA
jgi:dihydroneopterin aldolase